MGVFYRFFIYTLEVHIHENVVIVLAGTKYMYLYLVLNINTLFVKQYPMSLGLLHAKGTPDTN